MYSSVEAFTVAAFCVLDYCSEKGSNTFRGAVLNGGGQSLVSRTSVIPFQLVHYLGHHCVTIVQYQDY
ncbi:MAG: hypothetical protein WBL44_04310 [Nitrososphaeraceae archaeon]